VPETIYQALYVQGPRSSARWTCTDTCVPGVRSGPQRVLDHQAGKIPDMILIASDRAEVADRAVPGHGEGGLIVGVERAVRPSPPWERQTRYVMLVHLPVTTVPSPSGDGLLATIKTLRSTWRKSLTWDRVRSCPSTSRSPWPRRWTSTLDPHSHGSGGIQRDTNGLLRQYFPKGTDLSVHSPGAPA